MSELLNLLVLQKTSSHLRGFDKVLRNALILIVVHLSAPNMRAPITAKTESQSNAVIQGGANNDNLDNSTYMTMQ